jgi:hypothetical protein
MRGQIFSMDFLAAIFVFLLVFGVLLTSWGSIIDGIVRHNERKDMELLANTVADLFVSSGGYPYSWQFNPSTVRTIGLVRTNRVIDSSKLSTFLSMDYDQLKESMHISGYNFCFKLLNSAIEKCDFGEGEDMVSFSRRVVLYNGNPDVMEFRIWRYT